MTEMGTQLSVDANDAGFDLAGEIDAHTAPALEQALTERLESGASTITLDMAGVTFMDSSGLRIVIAATETARGSGGDLILSSPQSTVRRLVEVSGLSNHLTVQDA
ncbi:MAG: STAS domain-containing protein [Ilumatobacter sp.]|nr:STAS domain-containing protein [Ilumatobacter sp.]